MWSVAVIEGGGNGGGGERERGRERDRNNRMMKERERVGREREDSCQQIPDREVGFERGRGRWGWRGWGVARRKGLIANAVTR